MDLRSLQYALTLADELHFGRAAQAHYIGAQPFGRVIRELEHELGTRLFDRTSRRVELTAAGQRFLPRAQRVLRDIDTLMQVAEDDRDDPVLRVGVLGFGLADHWSVTRALLARHRPELRIAYVELDWERQYDAVRTGEVDVAILHDVGGAEGLALERVMDLERYAVVPVESDLAAADRLTSSDIVDHPCVTPVGQPGLSEWSGSQNFVGAQVRSPGNIPSAVAATGMVGVYAEPGRRYMPHPGVRYLPLEGPAAIVGIASRAGEQREQVRAFRQAVRAGTTIDELRSDRSVTAARAASSITPDGNPT